MKDRDYWFEISAFSNAVDSLYSARIALSSYRSNFKWKWAAIGVSQAVYGFSICALEQGDYYNTLDFSRLRKKHRDELANLFALGTTEAYMNGYELLTRLVSETNPDLMGFNRAVDLTVQIFSDGQHAVFRPMSLTDEQVKQVKQLRSELRNLFEHYVPIHWSIAIPKFYAPITSSLMYIEELICSGALVHNSSRSRILFRLTKDIRAQIALSEEQLSRGGSSIRAGESE